MIERDDLKALLVALVTAFILVVVAIRVDSSASRVALREAMGFDRGSFLDRNGQPLVSTPSSGTSADRLYVSASLAPIIGYRDPLARWHGLEARYNSFLSAARARADWRTFFLHLGGRSARGGAVRLTLDRRLQAVADRALGAVQGAAVAIDPATGGVLALVTRPYCSPSRLAAPAPYRACRTDSQGPTTNRALQTLFSPGSAFKIVTLSAAIDSGRFNLASTFSGADAFGPSPYFDNLEYPSNVTRSDLTQLTLAQALAFSDNFVFAHIGLVLGSNTLLQYAHRYYVGRRIPFTLPVTPSVVANGSPHPTRSEVAQSSFGAQPDRVTPLQMAMIAATVANGGVLMTPHLLDALVSPSGTILSRYRVHRLSSVMSRTAAQQVRTAMEFVVQHGSGYLADIHGIRVAGKTGTAASGAHKPNAWFICFAPADHPVVAVAVLHEFSGEGYKFAAPIARRILVAALNERGYHVR
ncbi:MAG: penicillin-binding transpeptidase domain-containing protein [Chloroflexota bacterium]